MSTTFQAFPTVSRIPSFREVVSGAERLFVEFLRRHTLVTATPRLGLEVRVSSTHQAISVGLDAPARWSPEEYAWFTIDGVPGGCDAYFEPFGNVDREIWSEEIGTPRYAPWAEPIRAALEIGHRWSFRRSAGQPAPINVAYGLIAAAVAALTDGIVESDDCAWDASSLPSRPRDFLAVYFDPAATADPATAEWARRCIDALPQELAG